jgi:hypothetical protein
MGEQVDKSGSSTGCNENAQPAPSETIAPRECEWKHGDSGYSAGEKNLVQQKNTRTHLTPTGLLMEGHYTQYQKAPTFAVSCESLKHHTYRKGAPL